jgi:hypothetical protein
MGMNRKVDGDYFAQYQNLCTEMNIQYKPQLIFNIMDEGGFPLE